MCMLLCVTVCWSQKVEFYQAQTRIIEPLQDVLVRPLVADLQLMKQTLVEYEPSWQFKTVKLEELTVEDLADAKTNATFLAASKEGADVIVAATYEVRNHREIKNGKEVVSEYGVDIIVRGFPAKYVNWHKMGEQADDIKWAPMLIDSQSVRGIQGHNTSVTKTEAIRK